MKYTKLITTFSVAALLLPGVALADASTTQSQIQSLLSQIHTLQQQLAALLASGSSQGTHAWTGASTTWNGPLMPPGQMGKQLCITLSRDLKEGSQGDDVKSLQEMLAQDPESGFTAAPTGFFGALTAKAIARFQMRNGIASSSAGVVGPLTRGFFERRCGKGLGNGNQHEEQHNDRDTHGKPTGGMLPRDAAVGTIASVASSSFTLQGSDGKSVTVAVTASTSIEVVSTSTPAHTGTVADIVVGKTVLAQGPTASDGSVTAVHVRVGPLPMPIMGGQGGHGPTIYSQPMHGGPMMHGMSGDDGAQDDQTDH